MDNDPRYICCPYCSGNIIVPPQFYGKTVKVMCRKCATEWTEKIPLFGVGMSDELLDDVKEILTDLPEELHDFLFGSGSKKR